MKTGIKVLLGPSSFAELDKAPYNKLVQNNFNVIDNPYKRKLTEEELLSLLPGVTGLIAGLEPLTRKVLEKSDLKVISRCGSGLSNVDLLAGKEMGITVTNTPLGPTTAVAELTLGCLLNLIRQVPQMNNSLHKKEWSKRIGKELTGSCVGIIGFGNIGRRVGRLLSIFGAKIIAVDPLLSGVVDNVPIVGIEEVLKEADIITLHSSGEDCLLDKQEFDLMKQGVYILNAARGSIINEEALKEALDNGKVAGAWLDTFGNEPYNGVLCDYEQVILTPHIGSYTVQCRSSMEMEAVENLIKALNTNG
jgi:D-3-phosphoglycerate dehydrogenase